ncbi:MAG: hypothetical protein M3Z23_09585 [Acidobacteriota bacterium]|nr:hypothetical protein [Acidobacteriota bacterium]
MPDTNGQKKTRLDWIEETIERQSKASEAAHDRFDRQHGSYQRRIWRIY